MQEPDKPRVDELEEVPFHELPPGDTVPFDRPLGAVCRNGSMVEVWSEVESDGFLVKLRKLLEDGRQSVLKFGLSKEWALVLCYLLDMKLYPPEVCSACGGLGMLPGYDQGQDDVMNTPCWKCNPSAKLCGNCQHHCGVFDAPRLGVHIHCNHPVLEVRDSPPYNNGWGTLRDVRQTCEHWSPRNDPHERTGATTKAQ